MLPAYLSIPAAELGRGQPVKVRVKGDMTSLAEDMAEAMLDEIVRAAKAGRGATLIVPVGPVDQFPILAHSLNEKKISCRQTVVINMDEYLSDDGGWVPETHPLSFRAYMNRQFYHLLDPSLAPPPENRVFPDPRQPEAVPRLIEVFAGAR